MEKKNSKFFINEETLTDIANAIRSKTYSSEKILTTNMAEAINSLSDNVNQNSLYEQVVGRVGDTDGNS